RSMLGEVRDSVCTGFNPFPVPFVRCKYLASLLIPQQPARSSCQCFCNRVRRPQPIPHMRPAMSKIHDKGHAALLQLLSLLAREATSEILKRLYVRRSVLPLYVLKGICVDNRPIWSLLGFVHECWRPFFGGEQLT